VAGDEQAPRTTAIVAAIVVIAILRTTDLQPFNFVLGDMGSAPRVKSTNPVDITGIFDICASPL